MALRSGTAAALVGLWLCLSPAAQAKKVVVLGIDGMDPKLLVRFAAAGTMPNFSRLMAEGDFCPLQTTSPPQSPVAWSSFITGMDPGGHGIYDFVHRDPRTLLPYLSISRAIPAQHILGLGSFVLPLGRGKVELLRQGRAFWEALGERGIPSILFRMPANFPPSAVPHSRQLSGMGTPDIRGTPGTFSFYAESPPEVAEVGGGEIYSVKVVDGQVQAELYGPKNPYRRISISKGQHEHPAATARFRAFVDRQAKAARFSVGGQEFILQEGEWSEWVRVDFPLVPGLVSTSAVARFYLKQVDPHFELYVTPLQINPEDPAMPISFPPDWAAELAASLGYFYTQEMPEDTKAFIHGIFTPREFLTQVMQVCAETQRIHAYLETQHEDGLLFVYYGTLDQGTHMLWHYADPAHPLFAGDPFLAGALQGLYQEMDRMLGQVLDHLEPETTLIVMSDHGFAPFYWGVNLNTYLLEKGYLALRDPSRQEEPSLLKDVDWSRTRAYALGLNGLYINLQGREREGIVAPGQEYERLLDQLEAELLALRDPRHGHSPVSLVTRPRRDFQGPYRESGPDLVVGYNLGYRSSWASALGEFPREVWVDNDQPWGSDHCIDYRLVPGVLVTNQEITLEAPTLLDLTAAILDEWGIPPLPGMIGRDCLQPRRRPAGTPLSQQE